MVAVVHAISMNYRKPGNEADDGALVHGGSESFTFRNLTLSTAYLIDWGDGGAKSSVTSDTSGLVTTTHTYTAAGAYTILVRDSGDTATVDSTDVQVG
jgi:PKD repeat protein